MPRDCILDTNLAVLFVVGTADRRFIAKHKRLRAYDEWDYDILCNLLDLHGGRFVVTPNVLTETSNLLRQTDELMGTRLAEVLARLIDETEERFVVSRTAVARHEYKRLGLTDAVLLELAAHDATLVTADNDLYLAAATAGHEAINFWHAKELRPDIQ